MIRNAHILVVSLALALGCGNPPADDSTVQTADTASEEEQYLIEGYLEETEPKEHEVAGLPTELSGTNLYTDVVDAGPNNPLSLTQSDDEMLVFKLSVRDERLAFTQVSEMPVEDRRFTGRVPLGWVALKARNSNYQGMLPYAGRGLIEKIQDNDVKLGTLMVESLSVALAIFSHTPFLDRTLPGHNNPTVTVFEKGTYDYGGLLRLGRLVVDMVPDEDLDSRLYQDLGQRYIDQMMRNHSTGMVGSLQDIIDDAIIESMDVESPVFQAYLRGDLSEYGVAVNIEWSLEKALADVLEDIETEGLKKYHQDSLSLMMREIVEPTNMPPAFDRYNGLVRQYVILQKSAEIIVRSGASGDEARTIRAELAEVVGFKSQDSYASDDQLKEVVLDTANAEDNPIQAVIESLREQYLP